MNFSLPDLSALAYPPMQGKPRKPLYAVPDATGTDVDYQRAKHLDLPDLADDQLWAEERVLENELAFRIYADIREQHCHLTDSAGYAMSDREWLRERIGRIRAERRRRGRAAA